MICPNCGRVMDGICMAGDDTHCYHEFYCNHCHTYLKFEYNPEVTNKILNEDKPKVNYDLPY